MDTAEKKDLHRYIYTEKGKKIDLDDIKDPTPEEKKQAEEALRDTLKTITQQINNTTGSWTKLLKSVNKALEDMGERLISVFSEFGITYGRELEKIQREEAYKDIDFSKDPRDPAWEIKDPDPRTIEAFEELERRVWTAFYEREETEGDEKKPEAFRVEKKELASLLMLDKTSKKFWKASDEAWEKAESNGSFNFLIPTGSKGRKKPYKNNAKPSIMLNIDLSDLSGVVTEKKLSIYDKRVMLAVAELYNAGIKEMTLTSIFTQMGNTSNPRSTELQKVNDSLTKLSHRIYIDRTEEIKAGFNKSKKILGGAVFDEAMINFSRLSVKYADGKMQAGIIVKEEPILVKQARLLDYSRNIPNVIRQSPPSKTEKNLKIEEYLLEEIFYIAERPEVSNRRLLKTLCEACNIGGKDPKRILSIIDEYLNHYKKHGLINDYKIGKTDKGESYIDLFMERKKISQKAFKNLEAKRGKLPEKK